MSEVKVIDHPLVQHKLSLMRMKETSTGKFRNLMREISMLLGYEVTRNLPLTMTPIETPVAPMHAPFLAERNLALVSILRAGNGILDGMLQLFPTAKVGHVGLYRDANANTVVEYYFKLPEDIHSRRALVLDPLLATGQSAVAAVSRLKEAQPISIDFVCLLASKKGLDYFQKHHKDVNIYTAGIDPTLNAQGFIEPGLGDAGDRLYGTR